MGLGGGGGGVAVGILIFLKKKFGASHPRMM